MALGRSKLHAGSSRRIRSGFTFIEMIAVTFVIAVVSLSVMARVVASQKGEQLRGFKAELARMALSGRERAIASGQSVTLSLGAGERSLQLSGAEQENSRISTGTVELPDDISTRDFQIDGEPVAATEWQVTFFADGTCTQAGIAFWDGESTEFAAVYDSKLGRAKVVEGQIPELFYERWEAGEMEIRGGGGPQP